MTGPTAHTDAARASAADAPADGLAHPRLVLLTTILASSLAFIDGSVVNVGLPAIGRSLQGASGGLQWVVNGYLLPLTALLLLGGALGDRYGRRRLLVSGTLLFALASAACAVAPSLEWLLLTRGLQGIAAALVMPNSLALLAGSFSGEARGRAIGTWAAVGSMAAAIGPVLGGTLVDGVGWRAIFLLNLPIAFATVWLALRYVAEDARAAGKAPLDLVGAGLVTLALCGLTWGLTVCSEPQGWSRDGVLAAIVGGVLLVAFLRWEKRIGDGAMVPLAMFGSRTYLGLSLLTLLLYAALGGLLVILPTVLIRSVGYSAAQAGASLLPLPLILTVASPIMGGVAGRIGPRWPLTIGPLLTAGGFLMLLRIDAGASYWTTTLPAMAVISMGMSGAVAPLTTAVLTSVDPRHTGSASGLNSALARAGGLVATALLGAVLADQGRALVHGFHVAAIAGAVAAAAAGACAFLTIGNGASRERASSP